MFILRIYFPSSHASFIFKHRLNAAIAVGNYFIYISRTGKQDLMWLILQQILM